MPYAIRKIGPDDKPYCVVNTETDDNKGCSATEADAKKHLAVLNMREHGVPEKKENEMAENDPTLSVEYIERLKTFEQAAIAFLGDKAPTPLPIVSPAQEQDATDDQVEKGTERAYVATDLQVEKATYACECLSCGHTLTSDEHCSDITCPECGGEMRREERPGVGKDVEQYTGGITPAEQPDDSPADELQLIDKKETDSSPEPPDLVPEPLPSHSPSSHSPAPIPELTRIEISKLDQIKLWVKSIFEKVCGKDEEESTLPLFITKQQSDGTFRWISISNTAFLDREQEIVSTEGVAKSIARADINHRYGPLLFWHEPITLGTCDFQAQEGVCLVESGLWDSTPLAKSVRTGLDTSPTPWGKSIGFLPLAQQEDVVIKGATVRRLWTDLQIVERSILPNSEAASLFTQITTRGLSMEQKKKDALVELLGDEALVNEVLAKADEINKAAADPDAIVKEAGDETPPSAAEDIKESQPEGEKATQTETVEPEVKEDTPAEDDSLLIAVKTLGTQVEALQLQVKALQEAQSAPRMAIHRPTLASDTADDADTEVQKASSNGEAPRAVQAISNQVLGIGG